MSDEPYAAIIGLMEVAEAIGTLREVGIYDDTRKIEPLEGDRLAIPVTEPRPVAGIEQYEAGVALTRRCNSLEDHLRSRGWTPEELDAAPNSYARIGDLIVINDPLDLRPTEVGEALLDLHGDCSGVLCIDTIEGQQREPSIEHIAGESRTETVHREHGIEYALDLSEVMFSPGNQRERVRMGNLVDTGEHVLDCCAGIGYFTLQMAAGGATVTAVEQNPTAFDWLSHNVTRNGLDHRVDTLCGDCRDVTATASRAVIGHLPVHDCRDDPRAFGDGYLDTAIRAVGSGWLHIHSIAWADETELAVDLMVSRLEAREVTVETASAHRVKGFAPSTDHLVIDVRIDS